MAALRKTRIANRDYAKPRRENKGIFYVAGTIFTEQWSYGIDLTDLAPVPRGGEATIDAAPSV
eukprot:277635-Rhodomonas_salina.1